jgi:ABC-2 type transport system permease protein
MQFRLDFFFRIVMDLAYYAITILFFKTLFLHTSELGNWSEAQVLVFASGFMIIDAIQMTFLSANLWYIGVFVNKGDLDYYLVRPVSTLFFLSLREISPNSLINLAFAIGIFVWALQGLEQFPSTFNLFLYCLLIANGVLVFYLIRMLAVLPVFWTHSDMGFARIFWYLQRLGEQPHQIYQGITKVLLLTALPFALLASVPAQVLFEGPKWATFGLAVLVSCLFSLLVAIFWKQGLRAYSSASS